MKLMRLIKPVVTVAVLGGLGFAGYATRSRWEPVLFPPPRTEAADGDHDDHDHDHDTPAVKVLVSAQAQANLGLKSRPLKPQTYWRTIQVPGMVVDRPGLSDRGVPAPVAGVVTRIARVPGEAVRPGDVLFTLRVLSESTHQTQADLFKATQDIALAQAQKKRLRESAGALPEARLIEVDNQLARLGAAVKAHRHELSCRGFAHEQIDAAAAGEFVHEVTVAVPAAPGEVPAAFEVQELKVDLGHQVQAGQSLCTLANHRALAVEGRAFRDDTPLLERAVSAGWAVEVDFQEDPAAGWGSVTQPLHVRHLANTIDPATRTFAFLIPLENESRAVRDGDRTQTLWRFRPGQKVRVLVKVEERKDVFVVPIDAVARDGPEAFVFTQNVNTFERKPVRVLLQDRQSVVLANDGSLRPGSYVAQSGAVQLNRMVKSGTGSEVPKGYHMHADGSLHKNH